MVAEAAAAFDASTRAFLVVACASRRSDVYPCLRTASARARRPSGCARRRWCHMFRHGPQYCIFGQCVHDLVCCSPGAMLRGRQVWGWIALCGVGPSFSDPSIWFQHFVVLSLSLLSRRDMHEKPRAEEQGNLLCQVSHHVALCLASVAVTSKTRLHHTAWRIVTTCPL